AVVNVPVPDDNLVARPLFAEDLVMVVPISHPLARAGPIPLAGLGELPLLLPMPGTAFRDELDAAVRAAGVTLQAKAELDGTPLIAALTFEGLGPAILPATAVPAYLRREWALVGVEGIPRRHIGVAQRRRGLLSGAARAVLEMLHELIADADARRRRPLPDRGHRGSRTGVPVGREPRLPRGHAEGHGGVAGHRGRLEGGGGPGRLLGGGRRAHGRGRQRARSESGRRPGPRPHPP